METRRNFLKKIGLVGIVGAFPFFETKNKRDSYELQDLYGEYGDNFIKKVIYFYKKEHPVFRRGTSPWDSGKFTRVVFLNIERGYYLNYYLDLPFKIIIHSHRQNDDKHCLSIEKDKQGLYSVYSDDGGVGYREEKGGKSFLISAAGRKILPLPEGNETFFKPYKELHDLVWKDVKKEFQEYKKFRKFN